MSDFNVFGVIWCSFVLVIMVVYTAWTINDLKQGSARNSFYGRRVTRSEEPVAFWLAVGGKLIVLPLGAFLLWHGLQMFGN